MRRAGVVLACCALLVCVAHAGGPRYVAGTTGFNPGLADTPVTWAGGQIVYYTDQGDLSPLETQASITALVADAFSRWTSVNTAAVAAIHGGALDEDVSGANVIRAGAVLTMPADIQPTSTKAVAIAYDADGKVTDALLGAGAAQVCSANMVFGGPDAFTPDAHIAHALLILNGACVRLASDIPLLRYRLIRAVGRILGLDWSQLNDNVAGGLPAPTMDDYNGFPLMHPAGSLCTPSYGCVYNADQLRADDRAALSRLYPVTPANLVQFPGKQVLATTTARIQGTVLLNSTPIEGVNVVARLLDATGKVTTRASVSCVSGFLFRGNAGNPITGFDNGGERFDHWGADDAALRGYFDLSGLETPAGSTSAQYELRLEPINAAYVGALAVGPYKSSQVTPPGSANPIVVTVTAGNTLTQDISLEASFTSDDLYEPHSFATPAAVPGGGQWAASLDPYGDLDWHALPLRARRTFTVDVTALDDAAGASANKALPVLGIWAPGADAAATPALAQTYFNVAARGTTRLQGSVSSDGVYKLGIGDYRGDGRPDFRYRARLLYADDVTPGHARPEGGTVLTITGLGFTATTAVRIGTAAATLVAFAPERLLAVAPGLPDGAYDVTLEDTATGAIAVVSNGVRYGGASDDVLQLLEGSNPPVPVGTEAPNPFRVRVLAGDNITPVAGASVRFQSPSSSVLLLPCGTRDCTLSTDAAGEASAWLMVQGAGAVTLSASLGSGASVAATVNGIASALAVSAAPPRNWVARNTAASVPLLARVVGSGLPLPGRMVDFQVMLGAATLTSKAVTTDANGEARSNLIIANMASEVRVSACVGVSPQTACDIFYIYAVANTGTRLQRAGGDEQWVAAGKPFLPVTVRATDAADPPNNQAGVPVTFRATAYQAQDAEPRVLRGEVLTGHNPQVIVVGTAQGTASSNGWGQASFVPSFAGLPEGATVEVVASAGDQEVKFTLHTWPAMPAAGSAGVTASEAGASSARTRTQKNYQKEKPVRPPRLSPGLD